MRGWYNPYRQTYNYYNYGPGRWQGTYGQQFPGMIPPGYYGGPQQYQPQQPQYPAPQYTPPSGGYGPNINYGQPGGGYGGGPGGDYAHPRGDPFRSAAPPQGQYGAPPSGGPPSDPRNKIPVIIAAARANGIDPNIALRVADAEGLHADGYNHDPRNPASDYGRSGGAFQLFLSGRPNGALGDIFMQETGLDPRDPKNEDATIYWAMHRVRQDGWGNGQTNGPGWHGAARQGISGQMGVGPLPPNTAAGGGQMYPPGTTRTQQGQWILPNTASGGPQGTPQYRAIGDSIAQGYQIYGGAAGSHSAQPVDPTNTTVDAAGGRTPSTVLQYLKSLPDGALKGQNIIFSTGVSNNPNEANLVPAQMQELKRLGAGNVQVVGVGNRAGAEGGQNYNLAPYNQPISVAAQQAGFKFTGPLPAIVHPDKSFYRPSIAGMPAPQNPQQQGQPPAQPQGPAPNLVTGGSLPGIAAGQPATGTGGPAATGWQSPQMVTGGALPGVPAGQTVSGGPQQSGPTYAAPQQPTPTQTSLPGPAPDLHPNVQLNPGQGGQGQGTQAASSPSPPATDAPWKYPWPSILIPGGENQSQGNGVILPPGEHMPPNLPTAAPQQASADLPTPQLTDPNANAGFYPFAAPQPAASSAPLGDATIPMTQGAAGNFQPEPPDRVSVDMMPGSPMPQQPYVPPMPPDRPFDYTF